MTTFQGGYTAGVGSVTWEQEYAERWRNGWCALGVYCANESAPTPADGSSNASGGKVAATPLSRPAGLYDPQKNTLFVRSLDSATATDTIAHETVHALQYQNYPHLHAAHLWYNRDLAAAVNSAIEGDAHIVGWYFDPRQRLYLCSMDARHAATNHARWWRWTPTRLWAHEGFPHVFGPELALRRLLLAGQDGSDALLRTPPLSTLHVLKPTHTAAVDFIDLPSELVSPALGERNCRIGLANTAGALGIWGLLRQHDAANTSAEQPPPLIEDWRGDRFAHIACPGERNDELAWLIRWRNAAAAQSFAIRYQRIASAVAEHGAVLGATPQATVRGSAVLVATPGLRDTLPLLAEAPIRTFARFEDWLASSCFPQDECGGPNTATTPKTDSDFPCAQASSPPPAFPHWLDTVRRARSTMEAPNPDTDAVVEAAGELATFCAVNTSGNSDLAQACRAVYSGIPYQTQLLKDPNWRGLPNCGNETDVRRLMRQALFADAELPSSVPPLFAGLYGTALAAGAFAKNGVAGLQALASAPPLSTRQILWPLLDEPVDFLASPNKELAALGCEIAASDVRGALAIWNLLLEHGPTANMNEPPPMLAEWRGDRQFHLRCGTDVNAESDAEGWIWTIRWASTAAAQWFATRYNALPPTAAQETGLAPLAEADGATVWIAPPSLATAKALLKDRLETRSYRSFDEWKQAGCFPQDGCN